MAKIDSAYNYYMSTYAEKEVSRYDCHKKSDLRKIYNNIVKANKESPLYKIPNLEDAKKFAIDVKEHAKSIQNVVASLSDRYGSFEDSFRKKVAVSSDEEQVSVKYVGDGTEENSSEEFTIAVEKLASPQINTGNFLMDEEMDFTPGSYSFDLNTNASSFELQYNVNYGETNRDIINKLHKLISTSNLGISSEIIEDGNGASALQFISNQTGLSDDEEYLFSIKPATSSGSIEAMNTLGINQVSSFAENSSFLVNGVSHSALSNTFTINNAFELSLEGLSTDGSVANVSFKSDNEAIADNIQTLVDSFNGILNTAEDYTNSNVGKGNKLIADISTCSRSHKSDLESIGLMVAINGSISIDREKLTAAVDPSRADKTFDILNSFKNAVGKKAENASIDPMNYVNKIIVTYKNPGHNFPAPYISSIYSGMMLDNYV